MHRIAPADGICRSAEGGVCLGAPDCFMEKIIRHHHWKQPKVLYLSSITAMFERFGYYIVASIASVSICAYLMGHPILADAFFYVGSAVIVLYFLYEIIISPGDEKAKIVVCLILIFMAVVFFLLYFQLYTSMELFIKRNVARAVWGFDIPTFFKMGLIGLVAAIIGLAVSPWLKRVAKLD